MDYLVESPVIVNGVRRKRGEKLTGDDAKAVEANPMIRKRCVPDRYAEELKNKTAPKKTAPSSSSDTSGKGA